MDVGEMRSREDFETVLCRTLEVEWSESEGHPITVHWKGGIGQRWLEMPFIGVFHRGSLTRVERRFVADLFRFTPVCRRAIPQYLLGSMLASRAGLHWLQRDAFRAQPGPRRAANCFVVPGNQRIRFFEFERGITRVRLKVGFAADSMRREIQVRVPDPEAPYVPLSASDPDGEWFEEPLIDGWALPRVPPWVRTQQALRAAFTRLEAWSSRARREADARERCAALLDLIERGLDGLRIRFPGQAALAHGREFGRLAALGSTLGRLVLERTHGDLQPGNVLVGRDGRAFIIDWEHSKERLRSYDAMVFHLRARYGVGMSDRLGRWIGTGRPRVCQRITSRAERRATAAVFMLEELGFHVSAATSGPYVQIPNGLRASLANVRRFARDWCLP